MLQRNPLNLGRISRTTCRFAECAEPDKIFMSPSFRLSLEKSDRARPPNMLGYQAVAPLSQVTKSARGANRGKRGVGAKGEEWWCLRCVESLFKAIQQCHFELIRQCEFELFPPVSKPQAHALFHWAQYIFPEERVIPRYPDKFRLDAPYRYCLEKWKAVILYNSQQEHGVHFKPDLPPHLSRTEELYTGPDGRSIYVSKESRDMRGLMEDGEEAEISAADCEDVSLGEVLKRVGRIMGAISRRKRERRLAEKREAQANTVGPAVKSHQFVIRQCSRRRSF